jgi:hypothetical protein
MMVLGGCAGLVTAGPKARRLAQARRAGLPVPDGLVLLPDEPLPTEAELVAALGALGGDFWPDCSKSALCGWSARLPWPRTWLDTALPACFAAWSG